MFKGQSICQKLALITTGAALSLAVIDTNPVQAITITYEFSTAGSSGKFSYDDVNEIRRELEPIVPGIPVIDRTYPIDEIEFFFNNRTYTEADSTKDPVWSVFEGLSGGDQFSWSTEDFSFVFANGPGPLPELFTAFEVDGEFVDTVSFRRVENEPPASVPEPGTVIGLSLLGLGCLSQRKIASSPRV
ncbi:MULTISPECIES: PEP-CTERM sorting domain-containing protein [unclassified Moorena]|uniref:PEP-CTERM sorting domain-containing protein n=1 Tax=unclassified Moorena TaxID=2683338 RepID=UPI001401454B|nr:MULTISPECIES: PEP-CTERM sorting domain-containing protein [unclassified Moorena]NEO11883.1 PEP-CTERM sorting domain-containing protein [Moorena sp. SIO3E8]NEQ03847.1 PEP-CTERM sorting domain-containing protein [Moorena sp. SIO3F7]